MKFSRSLSRRAPLLTLLAAPALVSVLGGCVFIKTPTPMPTPTPVPTPYGVQFDPTEGSPKGASLNNQAGGTVNPILPDFFRAALIVSGQELVLQPVKTLPAVGAKAPQMILGAADTLNPVRLAGIIVPTGNQTGAGETISVIQTWIAGQDLDVDIDPVFPDRYRQQTARPNLFQSAPRAICRTANVAQPDVGAFGLRDCRYVFADFVRPKSMALRRDVRAPEHSRSVENRYLSPIATAREIARQSKKFHCERRRAKQRRARIGRAGRARFSGFAWIA